MLNVELQDTEVVPFAVDDAAAVPGAVVRREAFRTQLYAAALLIPVLEDAHAAEGNDAAVVRGVFLGHDKVLRDHAEGRARLIPDRVELVPGPGAVEIEFPGGVCVT